ncbi:MAG: hypothetical protein ACRBHB_16460 [Arenicella sp.]
MKDIKVHFQSVLFAVCFFIASYHAHSAVIIVNADIGQSGCDLVEAINSANNDTSEGGCTGGSGDDLILLNVSGVLLSNVYEAKNGLPIISSNIHIRPVATEPTVILRNPSASTPLFRFFHVNGGALILENIVFSGGQVNLPTDTVFSPGGALYVFSGDLTLRDVEFHANYGGTGGAILLSGTEGFEATATIFRSLFINNASKFTGGAIDVGAYSGVTIFDSTFTENYSGRQGGAINIGGGDSSLSIFNATIVENESDREGGGVAMRTDINEPEQQISVLLRNSILSGNTCNDCSGGGAEFVEYSYTTGALSNLVTMQNNVIGSNNLANQQVALGSRWADYDIAPYNNIFATADADKPLPLENIVSDGVGSIGVDYHRPLPVKSPAVDNGLAYIVGGSFPFLNYAPGCAGTELVGFILPEYRTDRLKKARPIGAHCDIGALERDSALDEQCYTVEAKNEKTVVFCL